MPLAESVSVVRYRATSSTFLFQGCEHTSILAHVCVMSSIDLSHIVSHDLECQHR